MHKPLSTLMQQSLVTVAMDDPIEKVERLFRIHRQAYAIVLDEEQQYYGLITASHLLGFQMAWKNVGALQAREICQHRVIATQPSVSAREAAELMLRKNAEYLVVMEAGRVLGVVPVLALLRELLYELDPTLRQLRDDKGHFAGLL
jgi:signal-transduction protein with cAMP-binding, CBS, and nucleotidyltransferase domain